MRNALKRLAVRNFLWLLGAALAVAMILVWVLLDTFSDRAAWVQAVGSIAAILAAAIISLQENTRQQESRAKDEALRLQTKIQNIVCMCAAAAKSFDEVNDGLASGSSSLYLSSHFIQPSIKAANAALNSIPLFEIGNTKVIIKISSMRNIISAMEKYAEGHDSETREITQSADKANRSDSLKDLQQVTKKLLMGCIANLNQSNEGVGSCFDGDQPLKVSSADLENITNRSSLARSEKTDLWQYLKRRVKMNKLKCASWVAAVAWTTSAVELLYWHDIWPGTSEQWASWLQAIFSIIAIIVAIGLGWWQGVISRVQTLQIIKDETGRIKNIVAGLIVVSVHTTEEIQCADNDRQITHSNNKWEKWKTELISRQSALKEIPIHELPHGNAVLELLKAIEIIDDILALTVIAKNVALTAPEKLELANLLGNLQEKHNIFAGINLTNSGF